MEQLLDTIDNFIAASKRFMDQIREWWLKHQEKKRQVEIERLVTKLWRMNAIYKCSRDNLDAIDKYDEPEKQWYWIVDYNHKYIFRRD